MPPFPSGLKALFFDFDGTLVNSEPLHFQMWQQVLADYGVELTVEQYKAHYAGVPTALNAEDMVRRFALPVPHRVISDAKKTLTREVVAGAGFPLMPAVREILAHLSGYDLKLGIVTGAARRNVDITLAVHALHDYFSVIVSGEDISRNKPAPDCYLLAMEKLGMAPGDCLTFEDTESGARAAASAGVTCLAVPTPMSRHHDFSTARGVFTSLQEASAWVEMTFLV
ncbi:HAD family hydrolase [Tolumonas osonensis]|uniref:HAD superfamily hydrolase (TIGR01509 family) n=1 Tax=Tolumonas osonensis TaxID=675874 RepID=A0A841GN38_9GAMM|nr:HAD family phosphatase [Tolumonas osonensis]MBB6056725.1 HAD superfamily hydrolase (TIGR01509 family) [Tolumonas osonensis]